MADIFFSYKSDERDRVAPIVAALQAEGWTVFWDRKTPVGMSWSEYNQENLMAARTVVVAWSRQSIKNHWVRAEANEGRDRGCLVPLKLDDVTPPFGFAHIRAADFSQWAGDTDCQEWRALTDAIERLAPRDMTSAHPDKGHVFISYRRDGAENQRWAERIDERLRGHDFPVWRDVHGIEPGERWDHKIPPALDAASIVLCVVSDSVLDSDWVDAELNYAQRRKLLIVPIQVVNAYRPPFLLNGVQQLDLRPDDAAVWDKLIELVGRHAPSVRQPVSTKHADLRQRELEYLDRLLYTQKRTAQLAPLYTELSSVQQARAGLAKALPADLMPVSFKHEQENRRYEDILKIFTDYARARRAPRLVLLGEPGAGKSFSLRRLAAQRALEAQDDPAAPIPMFVELGDWLEKGQPLPRFLETALTPLGADMDKLIAAGRAYLLLDGLNEIPSAQQKYKFLQIKTFVQDQRLAGAVVTCRERDYTSLTDKRKLGLDTVTIEPLDPPRVHLFIQRYLDVVDEASARERGDALFWRLASGDPQNRWYLEAAQETWEALQQLGIGDFRRFWQREDLPAESLGEDIEWYGGLDRVIAAIEADRRSLLELAENPYLLTILLSLYLHGLLPEVGKSRVSVLQRFVDDLLLRERERHRKATGGEDPPGEVGLMVALGELAWRLQRATQEGQEEGVQTRIVLSSPAVTLTEDQKAHAAAANLLEVSERQVSFSHQLLQEHFAALGLKAEIDADKLSAKELFQRAEWWEPTGWEEVIRTVAGLYADDPTPLIEWLADANPELLADSLVFNGLAPIANPVLKPISLDWIARMTDPEREPDPGARAALGRAVCRLGLDGRPGVGLNTEGLPDIDWVEIPGGEFLYGEQKERRKLPTFYLARYPITKAQYQAFIDDDGYADKRKSADLAKRIERPEDPRWKEPNRPRETVSWYEAVAFCRWLSDRLGYEVRLPTEYEWEKTARGEDGREYPWGDGYRPGYANVNEQRTDAGPTALAQTTAVGLYPHGASPYGVEDLAGNVWEWCLNKYEDPESIDPGGIAGRALRGGSWYYYPHDARASFRYWFSPDFRGNLIGFRVMCSSPIAR